MKTLKECKDDVARISLNTKGYPAVNWAEFFDNATTDQRFNHLQEALDKVCELYASQFKLENLSQTLIDLQQQVAKENGCDCFEQIIEDRDWHSAYIFTEKAAQLYIGKVQSKFIETEASTHTFESISVPLFQKKVILPE